MKIAFVLAAGLLASAVMAADLPAAAPADAAKEKKICRNLDPMIGSNLSRRICKTREEWARQGVQDQPTTKDRVDVEKFRDMSTQFAAPR
ncbi:hypothetical protein [Sphingomonas crusticola]|uniref:hypothetical protein n=1 Tax=Sphingomonas crusticola TaxID=1697973 RepID=UPI000E264F3C|nr:hypothetical protein [Sphingomonas crusticola]